MCICNKALVNYANHNPPEVMPKTLIHSPVAGISFNELLLASGVIYNFREFTVFFHGFQFVLPEKYFTWRYRA
jgi:hypothetical protein